MLSWFLCLFFFRVFFLSQVERIWALVQFQRPRRCQLSLRLRGVTGTEASLIADCNSSGWPRASWRRQEGLGNGCFDWTSPLVLRFLLVSVLSDVHVNKSAVDARSPAWCWAFSMSRDSAGHWRLCLKAQRKFTSNIFKDSVSWSCHKTWGSPIEPSTAAALCWVLVSRDSRPRNLTNLHCRASGSFSELRAPFPWIREPSFAQGFPENHFDPKVDLWQRVGWRPRCLLPKSRALYTLTHPFLVEGPLRLPLTLEASDTPKRTRPRRQMKHWTLQVRGLGALLKDWIVQLLTSLPQFGWQNQTHIFTEIEVSRWSLFKSRSQTPKTSKTSGAI